MPTRNCPKLTTENSLDTTKVSKRSKQMLTNGTEPMTVLRIEEAAKMISEGKGKNDIIEHIQTKYKLSYDQSRRYWIAACHYLVPENEEEFRAALIKQNIERLEKIIVTTMEREDYKMAKDAISELNKTLGVGKEGVAIGVRNDPNNGTQEIVIKFD